MMRALAIVLVFLFQNGKLNILKIYSNFRLIKKITEIAVKNVLLETLQVINQQICFVKNTSRLLSEIKVNRNHHQRTGNFLKLATFFSKIKIQLCQFYSSKKMEFEFEFKKCNIKRITKVIHNCKKNI